MSEVIENHATSKLPRCLYEKTFISESIENRAISKLSNVHLNNHQCKRRRRFRRDRELSRMPIRSLKRPRNKSRKFFLTESRSERRYASSWLMMNS